MSCDLDTWWTVRLNKSCVCEKSMNNHNGMYVARRSETIGIPMNPKPTKLPKKHAQPNPTRTNETVADKWQTDASDQTQNPEPKCSFPPSCRSPIITTCLMIRHHVCVSAPTGGHRGIYILRVPSTHINHPYASPTHLPPIDIHPANGYGRVDGQVKLG